MLFCSMEFGNQYHDTSMMHINQTGGKHLKKSILIINENIDEAEKIKERLASAYNDV